MSRLPKYIVIGQMGKPQGVDGCLRVVIDPPYVDNALSANVLFLPLDGLNAPFFVEKWISQQPPVVRLEGVDKREAAASLAGLPLSLREADMTAVPLHEPESALDSLDGFLMIDDALGNIGSIQEVLEMPEQLMAVVDHEGTERLIPLNTTFITQVDADAKKVYVDLPEGLLEI